MATLNITTALRIFGSFEGASDLTSPVEAIDIALAKKLLNGTGSDQAEEFWSDERAISAGESLNFVDGTLTNYLGDGVKLAKIKGILLVNTSTTTGENLTLTGDILTNFGNITNLLLTPGGYLLWTAPTDGVTVATPASDVLTVTPSSGTITYKIAVWGTL